MKKTVTVTYDTKAAWEESAKAAGYAIVALPKQSLAVGLQPAPSAEAWPDWLALDEHLFLAGSCSKERGWLKLPKPETECLDRSEFLFSCLPSDLTLAEMVGLSERLMQAIKTKL